MRRLARVPTTAFAIIAGSCTQQGVSEHQPSDLRASIPVEIGKAYYRSGTRIPVKITNLTGRAQSYILIECGIYANGELIETAQRIWNDVPAGETATGDLLPDATRADRVDCRPSIKQ